MEWSNEILSSPKDLKFKSKDDFRSDRLSRWYTAYILLFCSFIVTSQLAFGKPLACWSRHEFTKAWTQYAENYCWSQNTYYVPYNDTIPKDSNLKQDLEINYYQWTPFALVFMALLFYLPRLVWRLLCARSGTNISNLIQSAQNCNTGPPQLPEGQTLNNFREEELNKLAKNMITLFMQVRGTGKNIRRFFACFCFSPRITSYLTTSYITVKLLYVLNVIGQLYLLNAFLGTKYTFYGWEILKDLSEGKEWPDSGHFPRVTLCDFDIRTMSEPIKYTIQCVLMINLLNEKIFIFLWFWFILVSIVTMTSVCGWLIKLLIPQIRNDLIKHYLKLSKVLGTGDNTYARGRSNFSNQIQSLNGPVSNGTKVNVQEFVETIGLDGFLLIYLLSENAGEIVTIDLIRRLWEIHFEGRMATPKEIEANNEADS